MSREIGFRVWDKQTKSYEWDKEFVLGPSGGLMELYSNHNGTWEYHFADTDRFIVEFDTGLKDKNGVKIHEGDIVREYDDGLSNVGKVEWDEYNAGFCVVWSMYDTDTLEEGQLTVIGNIHEAPKDFRPEHLKRMGVSVSKGGENAAQG